MSFRKVLHGDFRAVFALPAAAALFCTFNLPGGYSLAQSAAEQRVAQHHASEDRPGWLSDMYFDLGIRHYTGEGALHDLTDAFVFFREAAVLGHTAAQYNIGIMYERGQGVPRNIPEAAQWYELAAEQGHSNAQHNLGVLYHDGKGVPQLYAEALKWYELAAEQGHEGAQHNLGVMYANGEGVPQDYVEAHKWFNIAAARQSPAGTAGPRVNEIAAHNRELAAKKMTREQIAEAQKRAQVWMRRNE